MEIGVERLEVTFRLVSARSRIDERQQHHARLGGHKRVRRPGCHVQPRAWTQLELLAFDCKAKAPRQNLYRGCSGCLVLGELLACIEAKHGDVQSVAAVHNFGDDCSGLDGHFAGRIVDQGMRHTTIMLQAASEAHIGWRTDPDVLATEIQVARGAPDNRERA